MSGQLAGAAVLFDLDGTLIDTAADLGAALNATLAEAGAAPLSPEAVRATVGGGGRAMLAAGFAAAGRADLAADPGAFLPRFLDLYRAGIAETSRPFPGAMEAVEALKAAGAQVAICTNKREALARRLLNALGLTARFDALVGGDTADRPKPDPAPLHLCLERCGAARGVFVGDSDTDLTAAAAAGMPCLLATFGYGPTERADLAFAAFDTYADAPALVAAALTPPRGSADAASR